MVNRSFCIQFMAKSSDFPECILTAPLILKITGFPMLLLRKNDITDIIISTYGLCRDCVGVVLFV